jgi:hypothetical protein
MFTLRDQVFPREAGTARAVSAPAYEHEVGRVCDEVNANDRRRVREDRTIKRTLRRARTTMAQRNALLDGVRRAAARSGHTFSTFAALEPPRAYMATQRDTKAAWTRNLGRQRAYAEALDRAADRRELRRAIDLLSRLRAPLARDGDLVRTGLRRLGAENCDLEPPIVPRTFTLPDLRQRERPRPSVDTPPAPTPAPDPEPPAPAPDPAPPAPAPVPEPDPNTPSQPTPDPGVNTPPITGGGDGD